MVNTCVEPATRFRKANNRRMANNCAPISTKRNFSNFGLGLFPLPNPIVQSRPRNYICSTILSISGRRKIYICLSKWHYRKVGRKQWRPRI